MKLFYIHNKIADGRLNRAVVHTITFICVAINAQVSIRAPYKGLVFTTVAVLSKLSSVTSCITMRMSKIAGTRMSVFSFRFATVLSLFEGVWMS